MADRTLDEVCRSLSGYSQSIIVSCGLLVVKDGLVGCGDKSTAGRNTPLPTDLRPTSRSEREKWGTQFVFTA